MFIRVLLLIISLLFVRFAAYGEPISGSEILRSQELIQEDKSLRDKVIENKVFIKKIVISGAVLLSPDKIKEITLPFEKRWLTKNDIQEIEDLIKQEYNKQGIPEANLKLSHRVKNRVLEITLVKVKTP